jgi:hypothetical protein
MPIFWYQGTMGNDEGSPGLHAVSPPERSPQRQEASVPLLIHEWVVRTTMSSGPGSGQITSRNSTLFLAVNSTALAFIYFPLHFGIGCTIITISVNSTFDLKQGYHWQGFSTLKSFLRLLRVVIAVDMFVDQMQTDEFINKG